MRTKAADSAKRKPVSLIWRAENWVKTRLMTGRLNRQSAPLELCPPSELGVRLSGTGGSAVAFDVFDTLVRRTVAPEMVKRLSLDRLRRRLALPGIDTADLYRRRHRIEAELCRAMADQHGELEFRFADLAEALHEELSSEGFARALGERATFANRFLQCELAAERAVLRPIPEAVSVLANMIAEDRKVVLISDFYLPADALGQILAGLGVAVPEGRLFVSCDHLASKRSGRLYPIVAEVLGWAPEIMVGDNPHSDGTMARAAGIRSVLVDASVQHRFYASPAADPTCWPLAEQAFHQIVTPGDGPAGQSMRLVAPALLLFVERLYATARQRGYQHLFFLAREGQVLRNLFESHQTALGLTGDERITSHYLVVSRRICFISSLRPLEKEDFSGLFTNYRRISLGDFLLSLRFPAVEIQALAAELGIDAAQCETDFPTSATFARLKERPRFQAIYEELRSSQRDSFLDYLAQFGVPLESHPLVLVDVGWKGTIQDFIRATLPETIDVQGLYLGLLYAGQSVAGKTGLLFSNIHGLTEGYFDFSENRSLFEILLCADHGSALAFERAAGGKVTVIFDEDADEAVFVRDYVMPVTRDLEAAVDALDRKRLLHVISDAQWLGFVRENHRKLVFHPWHTAGRWLAGASHRENFGVFQISTFSQVGRRGIRDRLAFLKRLIGQPRRVILGSFWPAYTLYQEGGRWLASLYIGYRKWQSARGPLSVDHTPTSPRR